MKNHSKTLKFILSFFLVLTAVFAVSQHGTVAHAAGSDRIYYFNMGGEHLQGSMILVESNGHWGLMDAGHTSAKTIQDASGATFSTQVHGLSNQVYCRNGKDVANYMINKLGVKHLDFIVGTHAHSDHVGGVPEVAAATYRDSSGSTRYLVDGNTTYYYKEYQHISNLEDDLVKYSSDSWHNQAFAYQAAQAMANRGANLVDVSNLPAELIIHGDPGNSYGDYTTFNVGNMTFRLYNVYEQTNTGNENVNSIVTVMTNGKYTVVNLADINTNNAAIDKTSKAIAKDYGSVDVVVAGHHGYAGSNTKAMFDSLKPDFVVISNDAQPNTWLYTSCDLAAAIPYASKRYGTDFYGTNISYYATVTDLSGNKVYVYSVNGNGDLKNALNKMIKNTKKTGWVSWVQSDGTIWSYLEKGQSVKSAWRQLKGKWYRFDKYGIMKTGWYKSGDTYYYLDPETGARRGGWIQDKGQWYYLDNNKNSANFGKMLKGWQTVKNKRYYLSKTDGHMLANSWVGNRYVKSDGSMAKGWLQLNGKWYYMNTNKASGDYGKKMTGWQTVKDKRYYLNKDGTMASNRWVGSRYVKDDGSMAKGWLQLNGKWYYLDNNKNSANYGKYKTGWQTIKNKRYYLNKDGTMATDRWVGGTRYVKSDGSMAKGWLQLNGQWYYLDTNKNSANYGKYKTGWQTIKNKRYYLRKDGTMAKNTWVSGHYMTDSGAMATGWQLLDGKWYYLKKSGDAKQNGKYVTGWQTIGKQKYYFYKDGSMAANTWVGGVYVNNDGKVASGWQSVNGTWYYLNKNGKAKTGWQKVGGKDYYFYSDGKMAADTWVDGYYVDDTGAWVKGATPESVAAAKAAEQAKAEEAAAAAKEEEANLTALASETEETLETTVATGTTENQESGENTGDEAGSGNTGDNTGTGDQTGEGENTGGGVEGVGTGGNEGNTDTGSSNTNSGNEDENSGSASGNTTGGTSGGNAGDNTDTGNAGDGTNGNASSGASNETAGTDTEGTPAGNTGGDDTGTGSNPGMPANTGSDTGTTGGTSASAGDSGSSEGTDSTPAGTNQSGTTGNADQSNPSPAVQNNTVPQTPSESEESLNEAA